MQLNEASGDKLSSERYSCSLEKVEPPLNLFFFYEVDHEFKQL